MHTCAYSVVVYVFPPKTTNSYAPQQYNMALHPYLDYKTRLLRMDMCVRAVFTVQ